MITITLFNVAPLNAETGKPWPMAVEIKTETLIPNGVSKTKETFQFDTESHIVALAGVLDLLKKRDNGTS